MARLSVGMVRNPGRVKRGGKRERPKWGLRGGPGLAYLWSAMLYRPAIRKRVASECTVGLTTSGSPDLHGACGVGPWMRGVMFEIVRSTV